MKVLQIIKRMAESFVLALPLQFLLAIVELLGLLRLGISWGNPPVSALAKPTQAAG
ncbi:MAG TPA: hypothetical protein VFT65_11655 [Candidatus Angelobacter sp.]|nr:hypothetical protein [Candidatus Angelobacter sp.]